VFTEVERGDRGAVPSEMPVIRASLGCLLGDDAFVGAGRALQHREEWSAMVMFMHIRSLHCPTLMESFCT